MAVEMEGNREAKATPPVLEAPHGVSKGIRPLCSPLLPGVANSGTPPPDCRQTQVPSSSSKRLRKDPMHVLYSRTAAREACQWGQQHAMTTSSFEDQDIHDVSREPRPVDSTVDGLQPDCTGKTH